MYLLFFNKGYIKDKYMYSMFYKYIYVNMLLCR